MLQICLSQAPTFICAALITISELVKHKPGVVSLKSTVLVCVNINQWNWIEFQEKFVQYVEVYNYSRSNDWFEWQIMTMIQRINNAVFFYIIHFNWSNNKGNTSTKGQSMQQVKASYILYNYAGILHPSNFVSLAAIHNQRIFFQFFFKLPLWELSNNNLLHIYVFSHGSQMSNEISFKM